MKKIHPAIKYEVISTLAPYVKTKVIKEEFGIPYSTLDHYCKEYDNPKWQKSYSERKQYSWRSFEEQEAYEKEVRLRMAKEVIERHEQDSDLR